MERDIHLDTVGGLLIVYMIIGHVDQWADSGSTIVIPTMDMVLFFFMSWFFFKAGMFYRDKSDVLKKSMKRLLYPFFLWTAIGFAFHAVTALYHGDYSLIHYTLTPIKQLFLFGAVVGNLPLWFLSSLFIIRISYHYLQRSISSVAIASLTFALSALMITIRNSTGILLPDYFYSIPMGLFFFSAGKVLQVRQYNKSVITVAALLFLSHFCPPPPFYGRI